MGLTGFNRARRYAAAKLAAEQAGAEAEKIDDAVVNENNESEPVAAEQAGAEAENKPFVDPEPTSIAPVPDIDTMPKADLRAMADAIAERLGIKTPIVRATALDLQAFITEHQ